MFGQKNKIKKNDTLCQNIDLDTLVNKEIELYSFYKGKLPSYTDYCINSILLIRFKIYFLTDSKVDFHLMMIVVNLLSINSIYIEKLNDLNYFAVDNNPLWRAH